MPSRPLATLAIMDSAPGYSWARWLWLRALGLIFVSAFYSLAFQIHGLVGERGILPATAYLEDLRHAAPAATRLWYAPTVFWIGAGDRALTMGVGTGLLFALLLTANVMPRLSTAVSTVLFLACIAVLQDFSSYQSDGMLLEAGFISIFFSPRGFRPGRGRGDPPSRASLFMLRWEWFRIYFESGVAKLASGDIHWRNLTAMDEYYQNGPLPAWPGWYVQQLPHACHAATAAFTLVVELAVVWAMFLPRRFRLACFTLVTALQLGIIATANYAFLNYLVLALGVLLLDDEIIGRLRAARQPFPSQPPRTARWQRRAEVALLGWLFYATLVAALAPRAHVLSWPARLLEPFRVANAYGLFANMTDARYEIEFQGSADGGATWAPYEFRYKPQDVRERPGVYAPFQPRFDWNLWFASLGPWRASPWVVATQERLIEGSPDVLALFRRNPFPAAPPSQVRTVLWQYWFTNRSEKARTGAWWRRRPLGLFSGRLARQPNGTLSLSESP